jgi:hypothetical protein
MGVFIKQWGRLPDFDYEMILMQGVLHLGQWKTNLPAVCSLKEPGLSSIFLKGSQRLHVFLEPIGIARKR